MTPSLRGTAARTLLVDITAPLIIYYVLHSLGTSDVVALTTAAVPPVIGAFYSAIRYRQISPINLTVLVTMTVGVLVGLVTNNPRTLLVRGAWLSAPVGLGTLASLRFSQPLCYQATRALLPHRAEVMDTLWESNPQFRRTFRTITILWGIVLLVDSGLRVVMAYTLPISVVPMLDTGVSIATIILLQLPTHLLLRRSGTWHLLFQRRAAHSDSSIRRDEN